MQRLQEIRHRDKILEVVVVDNDPCQSAKPVVSNWIAKSLIPVVGVNVPTPNISLARNASVRTAKGEWLAMIDDDEIPTTVWLDELLKTQRSFRSDIVHGPVIPIYPAGTPGWVKKGGFFEYPRHVTGTPLSVTDLRTGNVLVRRSILADLASPFDPAYGRTGGGDTALFKQLLEEGVSGHWSDEAIVSEHISESRISRAWITQRAFRTGQASVHIGIVNPSWRAGLYSIRRICVDPVRHLLLIPFSMATAMQRWCSAAFHLGRLTAFAGFRYKEYRH